ncbi:J domain-containing protein CG6693-like [Anopheles maculipalpis]|uniref:J domain-containing protein CG6693-like n=1 Tax=Anopheles maculipalpis TaxID=1496333 RepID=UPI002158E061|nr:J domain-containing protein CG6693-like [Anopheles maculipalpis]
MSAQTLDACEKYFGTKNIYELFGVEKTEKDFRKRYYWLLLHNDLELISASEKAEAIAKEQLLKTLYNILKHPKSRAEYDENGVVNAELEAAVNRAAEGQMFHKPTTAEDIEMYRGCYIGSAKERSDIKEVYLKGKGCMNYMMKNLHFMACKDEPRLVAIVQEMINWKEVPVYETFTKELKEKRTRRHAAHAREAAMAQQMQEEKQCGLDQAAYEQKIAEERKEAFFAMISSMEARYRDKGEVGISIDSLGE